MNVCLSLHKLWRHTQGTHESGLEWGVLVVVGAECQVGIKQIGTEMGGKLFTVYLFILLRFKSHMDILLIQNIK